MVITKLEINRLKHALYASWSEGSAHIAVRGSWSGANRALGQCAVTAYLVHKLFGGEIIKARVVGEDQPHYWNCLPDGSEMDLTRSQFNKTPEFFDKQTKPVGELESDIDLMQRYATLRSNFDSFFVKESELNNRVASCRSCEEVDNFAHGSIYFGSDCSYLFVGEAPARNGWRRTGKAWVNDAGKVIPTGQVFEKLLRIIDLGLSEATYIEAIKCFPYNRKSLSMKAQNCKSYMEEQINLLKPEVVVTLGEFSSRVLLGSSNPFKKLSDIVGNMYSVKINGISYKVFPVYHPSPISPKSYNGNKPLFKQLARK